MYLKKMLTCLMAVMMLCAVVPAQAQIDNRLHWYDGAITYTVTHLDHNDVQMYAMDEGEEHEFILRYRKEMNPGHQIYVVDNGLHDYVNEYGVGKTARRHAEHRSITHSSVTRSPFSTPVCGCVIFTRTSSPIFSPS